MLNMVPDGFFYFGKSEGRKSRGTVPLTPCSVNILNKNLQNDRQTLSNKEESRFQKTIIVTATELVSRNLLLLCFAMLSLNKHIFT
jgi:hypothetical protein